MTKALLYNQTSKKIIFLMNKISLKLSWKAKIKFWKNLFSKIKKIKKFLMKTKI